MFIEDIIKKLKSINKLNEESIIFFLLGFLTLLFNYLFKNSIDNNIISILLIVFVVFFGLPHGALDTLVAKHYKIYNNKKEFFLFNLLYIISAFLVFSVWNLFSIFSLYIFLLISGIHFSEDWKNTCLNKIEQLTMGFSLINFPLIFHEEKIKIIYSFITNEVNFFSIIELQLIFAYINFILMIILLFKKYFEKNILTQVISIFVFSYALDPILFFITYFCFFHSVKNYNESLNLLKKEKQKNVSSAIFFNTLITCLVGIIIYIIFFNEFSFKNINTIIFIGLAALTVPHMLLRLFIKYKL